MQKSSMIKENIKCSDCGQFTHRERTVGSKSTPEQYGYCTYYDRQTSAETFYSVCPGASRIKVVAEKPKIVKKTALKKTTKSSRK
jgi:hypothetical protein